MKGSVIRMSISKSKIWILYLSAFLSISSLIPYSVATAEIKLSDPIKFKEPHQLILVNPKGALRWEHNIGAIVSTSAAISADGTIYVGAEDKKLYAINPDGTRKWDIALGGTIHSTPAIGSDGTIYAASDDDKLYAINPIGNKKWEFTIGGAKSVPIFYRSYGSPVIGADGTIYVGGTDDMKLYAVNPDGTKKWDFIAGSSVLFQTIGADGTIYAGTSTPDNKLYAIKPNGVKKWTVDATQPVVKPAIGADGTIYSGSFNTNLFAVNPDGSKKWLYKYEVKSNPVIGTDGMIYIGTSSDLFGLNSDGAVKWGFHAGNNVRSTPAFGADGTIYVGTDNQVLYAINPEGKVNWEFAAGGFGYENPAIGADGTIYMGSWDGKLYAIGTIGASSVSLNKNAIKLQTGESEMLTATVVPDTATNKNGAWTSSDNKIAAVDSTGKVTGIAPGTAKITVTTADGGFIGSCIVTVTAGSSTPLIPQVSLSDISEHWAKANIIKAVELKIASGYPDGTFRPNGNITRAEFSVLLMNGIKPAGEGTELTFTDKDKIGGWAAKAVAQAVQLGIINGYSDGTFRPDKNITHSEMIIMVVKASGLPINENAKTTFDDDSDIPGWAKGAAAVARQSGITDYIGDNHFAPNAMATRAEAVTAILNMLDKK
jgi:outer membrane protein assembly factor BamB